MIARARTLVVRLLAARGRELGPRSRTLALTAAFVAFVVMFVIAVRNRPDVEGGVRWALLVIGVVGLVPVTMFLKSLEYGAASSLLGRGARFEEAIEIAVIGAAANLLPLPGSLLVATYSLSSVEDANLGRAASATATIGLAWLAVSSLAAGTVLILVGHFAIGAVAVLVGLAFGLGASLSMQARTGSDWVAHAARVFSIELLFLAAGVLRLWIVAEALRLETPWWRLASLPVAGAFGTAVGVVPAGLGVREGLVALISPAVDLSVAEGLLLAVVDRSVWLAGLALCAGTFVTLRGRRGRAVIAPPR